MSVTSHEHDVFCTVSECALGRDGQGNASKRWNDPCQSPPPPTSSALTSGATLSLQMRALEMKRLVLETKTEPSSKATWSGASTTSQD